MSAAFDRMSERMDKVLAKQLDLQTSSDSSETAGSEYGSAEDESLGARV